MEHKQPRLGARLRVPLIATVVITAILATAIFSVSYRSQGTITSDMTSSDTAFTSNSIIVSSSATLLASNTGSSSTVSPAPCAEPYRVPVDNQTIFSNGTQIIKSAQPAFVANTGSTMDLCVEYVDQAWGNQTVSAPTPVDVFSWPSNFPNSEPPTNDVVGSPSLANITLAPGQSTVIEYKVSTGENSTGFDGLGLGPMGSLNCTAIPIAVGYQPSQVNLSDFPNIYSSGVFGGGVPSCYQGPLRGQIIGYTGASIAYLRGEKILNLTEYVSDISVSSFPSPNAGENVTFKMNVQSFSKPLTLGNSVSGYIWTFNGNPELTPDAANNYCGWQADNGSAISSETYTAFNGLPSGYLQIDEPSLQIDPHSSAAYSFSILIRGPIAEYTAIQVQSDAAVADFLPVSIAGQLQTNTGSCSSIIH